MDKVYRIAICDDEEVWSSAIKRYVDQHFLHRHNEGVVDIFESAESFLESNLDYDILFLDIELPEISGIQLKNWLVKTEKNIKIIFVTSYEQFMKEAFGKNVYYYVYKDEIHRIPDILDKIEKEYHDYEIIEIAGTKFNTINIVYLAAKGSYTEVNMKEGNKILCSSSINKFLEKLNNDAFIRTHKSFAVNMKYIIHYDYKNVQLQNDHHVTLGRSHVTEFKERYFVYLKNRVKQ